MTTPKIKVSDFITASRKYAESVVDRANVDHNRYLTKPEAKALRDLQDNFANYGKLTGKPVKAKDFVTHFVSYVAANANKAANKDGYLTLSGGNKLPLDLRDNFKNFAAAVAAHPVFPTTEETVQDKTSAARVAAHLTAYGQHHIAYPEAFASAIQAVLRDREYGPGAAFKEIGIENGVDLSEAKIAAELKKDFKSMTLLAPGKSEDSGLDPKAEWIFRVDCDVGSGHGFWVGVDRKSGSTEVTSFD